MPADECCDCGEFHPYGEGLRGGRCYPCRVLFRERRAEARAKLEPTEETREELQPQPVEKKEPPPTEEAEEEQ